MKKFFTFLLVTFCLGVVLPAQQLVDVVTGLSVPFGLELHNGELYVTSQSTAGAGTYAGKIVKFDPSVANPVPEVVTEFPIATSVAFHGNKMYAANFNSIVKVDLSAPNPTPTVLLPNLGFPNGLLVIEDELYFCQTTSGHISKIDLTEENPTLQSVVTSGLLGPIDLVNKDDILYIAENDGGKVASINLTDANPTPVTLVDGLSSPVSLSLDSDFLYAAVLGEIIRINLLDDVVSFVSFIDDVSLPYGSAFFEGELYLTEFALDKVVKVTDITPVWNVPGPVCASETSAILGGASPTGGIYSGAGVMDNGNGQDFTFDATVTGAGMVTYTLDGQSVNVQIAITTAPDISVIPTSNYNGQTISCAGASDGALSVIVSSGTMPYTYLWDNGATSSTISGLGAGNYSVTVTDANTCVTSSSITISTPSAISLSTSSTAATAGLMDGTASAEASGGTPPYTYLWMPGGQTTVTATGLSGGTYQVVVTDVNNCQVTASVEVDEIMLPADNECSGANDIHSLFGQAVNEPQVSSLYDNTGYTTTNDPTSGWEDCFVDASLQHTIWYTFMGDGSTYRIRTVQCDATNYITSGDTQAEIYSGSDCNSLTPVACNDDEDEPNQVFNFSIELQTDVDSTYFLMIDGWNGVEGEFCIEVTRLEEEVETTPVTFQVDASILVANGELSADGMHLAGAFNNFTGEPMIEGTGNIWTLTLDLEPGIYTYKFQNGLGGWESIDTSIGDDCTVGGYGDRQIEVGDVAITTNLVCFGYCVPCDGGVIGNSNEQMLENGVEVFPNPAKDVLNIRIDLPQATDNLSIRLLNVFGQVIYEQYLGQLKNDLIKLDLSKLPAGAYQLQIRDGQAPYIQTVVKQ